MDYILERDDAALQRRAAPDQRENGVSHVADQSNDNSKPGATRPRALMKTVVVGLILAAVASLFVWGPFGPVLVAAGLGSLLAVFAYIAILNLVWVVAFCAIVRFLVWFADRWIVSRRVRPSKNLLPAIDPRSAEQARYMGLDAVQRALRPISAPKRRVYSEAEAEAWSELASGFDADYNNPFA